MDYLSKKETKNQTRLNIKKGALAPFFVKNIKSLSFCTKYCLLMQISPKIQIPFCCLLFEFSTASKTFPLYFFESFPQEDWLAHWLHPPFPQLPFFISSILFCILRMLWYTMANTNITGTNFVITNSKSNATHAPSLNITIHKLMQ